MRIEYIVVGFVLLFIVLYIALSMLGVVGEGFGSIVKLFSAQ